MSHKTVGNKDVNLKLKMVHFSVGDYNAYIFYFYALRLVFKIYIFIWFNLSLIIYNLKWYHGRKPSIVKRGHFLSEATWAVMVPGFCSCFWDTMGKKKDTVPALNWLALGHWLSFHFWEIKIKIDTSHIFPSFDNKIKYLL
jgi:hypothetical protein